MCICLSDLSSNSPQAPVQLPCIVMCTLRTLYEAAVSSSVADRAMPRKARVFADGWRLISRSDRSMLAISVTATHHNWHVIHVSLHISTSLIHCNAYDRYNPTKLSTIRLWTHLCLVISTTPFVTNCHYGAHWVSCESRAHNKFIPIDIQASLREVRSCCSHTNSTCTLQDTLQDNRLHCRIRLLDLGCCNCSAGVQSCVWCFIAWV